MSKPKSKSKRELLRLLICSKMADIERTFQRVFQQQVEMRGKMHTQARQILQTSENISPSLIRFGLHRGQLISAKLPKTRELKENCTEICNKRLGVTKFSRIYKRKKSRWFPTMIWAGASRRGEAKMRPGKLSLITRITTMEQTTIHAFQKRILFRSIFPLQTTKCKRMQRKTKHSNRAREVHPTKWV